MPTYTISVFPDQENTGRYAAAVSTRYDELRWQGSNFFTQSGARRAAKNAARKLDKTQRRNMRSVSQYTPRSFRECMADAWSDFIDFLAPF
jgi:hypothetical protein